MKRSAEENSESCLWSAYFQQGCKELQGPDVKSLLKLTQTPKSQKDKTYEHTQEQISVTSGEAEVS